MLDAALRARARTLARGWGLAALIAAAIVLGALAVGVLWPGIPLIGLGGRWHVLGLGVWWILAGLAAALALTIAALSSRGATARRVLTGATVLCLASGAVFGSALGAAAGAAVSRGAESTSLTLAGFSATAVSNAHHANETEIYAVDEVTGDQLLIDIYVPPAADAPAAPAPAPVLLYLHGGGWILHDRTLHAATLRALADSGIVVMSADYSLATPDRPTWQSAGEQSACALAWAASNAERFGGDPGRIVLAGDSAGGALALTTAYRAASGSVTPQCGGAAAGSPLPVPAGVAGIVPAVDVAGMYANPDAAMSRYSRTMVSRYLGGTPAEHPDRVAAVDAAGHLTANAPPTLLVTVEHDHLVPSEGARMLAAAARSLDVPVTVVEVPFADHGLLARADGLGAVITRAALLAFILELAPTES